MLNINPEWLEDKLEIREDAYMVIPPGWKVVTENGKRVMRKDKDAPASLEQIEDAVCTYDPAHYAAVLDVLRHQRCARAWLASCKPTVEKL